jgi:hypothetical protein
MVTFRLRTWDFLDLSDQTSNLDQRVENLMGLELEQGLKRGSGLSHLKLELEVGLDSW